MLLEVADSEELDVRWTWENTRLVKWQSITDQTWRVWEKPYEWSDHITRTTQRKYKAFKPPYITKHRFQVIHERILLFLAFAKLCPCQGKWILRFSESFHELVPFIEHINHKLFEVGLLILSIMELWRVLRDCRHYIAHHVGDRAKRRSPEESRWRSCEIYVQLHGLSKFNRSHFL